MGLGEPGLEVLGEVTYHVTDLVGEKLAFAVGSRIFVDAAAAGFGWFIDSNSLDHHEFPVGVVDGVFEADPSSEAYGKMDLFSVLLHEMGHVLGLSGRAASEPQALMTETLASGIRRLPSAGDVDAVMAADYWLAESWLREDDD